MDFVEQLKQDGIAKGLCQGWQMKLKPGTSTKRLVELFIRGIDFCIKNDYPTLDFMRTHFRGISEPYGAYVDDEVVEENKPGVVLNGNCKAALEYDGFSVSQVYVRHNSQAAIIASEYANVTIDAFDDSHLVVAVAGGNAQVYVNLYGNATVETSGNGIKVRKTNKKTY